jgi:hypothetical protein
MDIFARFFGDVSATFREISWRAAFGWCALKRKGKFQNGDNSG